MEKPIIMSFADYPREMMLRFIEQDILSSYEFEHYQGASEEEAIEHIKNATIVCHGPSKPYISRKILEAAKQLKLVQFVSAGYAQVDLEAATELKIPVANNPGFNATPVSEYTIMAILILMRRPFMGHHQNTQGKWIQQEYMGIRNKLCELTGKTVGILGLGAIGTEVAKKISAFDCRILYNKRNRLPDSQEQALGVEYGSFDRLLEESDVLTVHVPLSDETRNMIGKDEFMRMKDGAFLINTARSDIVDEAALADALSSGKLLGAAIDVPRSPEAVPLFHQRFGEMENVLITPHIASGSRETHIRIKIQPAENYRRILQDEKPLYCVNNV